MLIKIVIICIIGIYVSYLVRVFYLSFKRYSVKNSTRKALILALFNTFSHALVIEYGGVLKDEDKFL